MTLRAWFAYLRRALTVRLTTCLYCGKPKSWWDTDCGEPACESMRFDEGIW